MGQTRHKHKIVNFQQVCLIMPIFHLISCEIRIDTLQVFVVVPIFFLLITNDYTNFGLLEVNWAR